MKRRLVLASACSAFAVLASAIDATAAVVRSVRASANETSTSIIVEVEGAFRYRTKAGPNGAFVYVDIEDALLPSGAARMVPVSDARVDGVIVLDDAAARIVRISVDVAGRVPPKLEASVDGSRLVLTFVASEQSDDSKPGRVATAGSAGKSVARSTSSSPESSSESRAGSASQSSRQSSRESSRPARSKTPAGEKARAVAASSAPLEPRSKKSGAEAAREATVARPARSIVERPVVVLDPGHGGKDPGARAWTGEYEKDIVLDLAERVARRLRKSGEVDVVMTRSGDEYVTLADRRDAARRWDAAVFVSIHANASPSAAARGIETYYHPRSPGSSKAQVVDREVRRLARVENGGKSARDRSAAKGGVTRASLAHAPAPLLDRRSESIRLATQVQTELVRQLGIRYETVRDLGAKEGPFFVIGENAAPSVLVEAAFLTHREEGLRMRSEVFREQIADGISRGILAFVEQQRRDGAL